MKILVIGMSPYNLTSNGKITQKILKYLYLNNHSVASIVYLHDVNYYTPNENNEFFYSFQYQDKNHNIPITPINKSNKEVVIVYEYIKQTKPDIIISIGEIQDYYYLDAIKQFNSVNFEWINIILNYQYPINSEHLQTLEKCNYIIACNEYVFNKLKNHSNVSFSYFGHNDQIFTKKEKNADKFRCMCIPKNVQSDNVATIIEVFAKFYEFYSDTELYLHTNVQEKGDYNLLKLCQKFDPDYKFIKLPDKYITFSDGISDKEMAEQYQKSHLYISIPFSSATNISVFEAMACNCDLLLSNTEMNFELMNKIDKLDNVVGGIKTMTIGESYLTIINPDLMLNKLIKKYNIWKTDKKQKEYDRFCAKYNENAFLMQLTDVIKKYEFTKEQRKDDTKNNNEIIYLD